MKLSRAASFWLLATVFAFFIRASLVLVVGVGITELAVALGSAVGLYAGSVTESFLPSYSRAFT